MNKIEKLEKYVQKPNLTFYGAYIHDGTDIELCDDTEREDDYFFNVKQRIENNVMHTEIERKYMRNHKKILETSVQRVELEDGEILVYVTGLGFVIPEYKMCSIEEAIEDYKKIK